VLAEKVKFDNPMYFDHYIYDIYLPNLQINDHTNYPHTLNVTQKYTAKDKLESQQLLAKRSDNEEKDLLKIKILMFNTPLEKTCPLARDEKMQQYDKHIKIEMGSARLNLSKEYLYRVYEYMYYQLLSAISDANPYYPLLQDCQATFRSLLKQASGSIEDVPETKYLTHYYNNALNSHLFNDLQQSPYCTGIELHATHPLFIVKDRNYLKLGKIRIEANEVTITTSI